MDEETIKSYNERHLKEKPCLGCGSLLREFICPEGFNRARCSEYVRWVEGFIWPEWSSVSEESPRK